MRACADNAAIENGFTLLQNNVLNQRSWDTREQLRLAIVHWIKARYRHKRRQRQLEKSTPIKFQAIKNTTLDLTA